MQILQILLLLSGFATGPMDSATLSPGFDVDAPAAAVTALAPDTGQSNLNFDTKWYPWCSDECEDGHADDDCPYWCRPPE